MKCDHRGKGEGSEGKKGQFQELFHFCSIEVFLKEVLGLLAQPFKLKRDCM